MDERMAGCQQSNYLWRQLASYFFLGGKVFGS